MCHLPPLFPDKSSTAAALARHYGGACLSVDAVVTDVLMNGTSPVGLTARQLYDCAAAQYAENKPGNTGKLKILCMHCSSALILTRIFVFVYL